MPSNDTPSLGGGHDRGSSQDSVRGPAGMKPSLSDLTRDLNEDAARGRIDPVIGRDREVRQMITALCLRTRNNVALLGRPGVGKTAIVEGLALMIHEGRVPPQIAGARLLSVGMGDLLAGTSKRGEFEQRLLLVLREAEAPGANVILFIDELHTITDAGGEGASSAAQLLKPALARGNLRLIGATTLVEWKLIERDGALARRFSTVMIEEPTPEQTIAILQKLKQPLLAHHGVRISGEAIDAAVRLSLRYIPDIALPAKAIDLLDQAAARVQLLASTDPEEAQRRLAQMRALLEKRVSQAEAEAEASADPTQAADHAQASQHAQLRAWLEETRSGIIRPGAISVESADVAQVLAEQTGIPLGQLAGDDKKRLLGLASELHQRIIGQEEAVTAVAAAVQRARSLLSEAKRPDGVFLFVGPTGVGKTELARALAEVLFGDEEAMIRFDLSEFSETQSIYRLIGAPPTWVGYGQGGELTEPVRRKPYSVVLLDEFEKAHENIHQLFLQMFEDGRLTDGEGNTIDFSNTIIILTSNLGSKGAASTNEEMEEAVRRALPPELFNRIEEVVPFCSLTQEQMKRICQLLLQSLSKRLTEQHGIKLRFASTLITDLAERGFDPDLGARPLRRVISRTVERALTQALLREQIHSGDEVLLQLSEAGEIALRRRARSTLPQEENEALRALRNENE